MLAWFRQIDNARSPGELVSIARDYLATWTPEDLARLPRSCRPGRMKSMRDLEDLYGSLVEEYRRTSAVGDDLTALQRLTSFVVRASIRLTQLTADDDPEGEAQAQGPKRAAARLRD